MKVFVTGGTGFIGANLIKALVQAGHTVVALRRQGLSHCETQHEQMKWCIGGLTDDWTKDMQSCATFLHLASAGVTGPFDDWETAFRVNVHESLSAWRHAATAGIKRFIIFGSCFEYGRSGEAYLQIPPSAPLLPTTAYAASKAAASMAAIALATELKLELVVLRPFHVFGPGEDDARFWPSLVSAAKSGRDFHMTLGQQVRDFQHVEQTCLQILTWLERTIIPGTPEICNLGSGRAQTLLDFAVKEWRRLGGTGKVIPGSYPYRENEVMRYVPMVSQ